MAIISAADLKTHLGITDVTDDTTITTAVSAADLAVKQFCGREFDVTGVGSETARSFYTRDARVVDVDDFYDTTNLVVETDTGDDGTFETTIASTDYQLEPLNGRSAGLAVPYTRIVAVESVTFPTSGYRPTVQVTAAWGYAATIPATVKQAALIKAARIWKRKDSVEGVAGFSEFGVVRISNREDPDVAALLGPYVRFGGAGFPMVG